MQEKTETLTAGVDHVGLAVADLTRSRAFFTDCLGWQQIGERPEYPAAFVSDGHSRLTLWQVADPATCVPFDRRRNVGLHHLALKVPGRAQLDALHDARDVRARKACIGGAHEQQRRAERHQHVGAHARGLVGQLALQADAGADDERHGQPSDDPHQVREVRKRAGEFIHHAAHGAPWVSGGARQAPAGAGVAAR